MSKVVCKSCGKELPNRGFACSCGYMEEMDDKTLWKIVSSYGKLHDVATVITYTGIAAFLIGSLMAVFGNVVAGIVTVLIGTVLLFGGGIWKSNLHGLQSQLLNDRLGAFFDAEHKRIVGPYTVFKKNEDYEKFRGVLKATSVFKDGNEFEARQLVEGTFKGMHYTTANVSINHCEKKEYRDNDGDLKTETDRTKLFDGIWIIVQQAKAVENAVYVHERKVKRNGKYDVKALPAGIELENTEWGEKYAVYSDSQHDAFYVLTPQLMEQLEALDKAAGARTSVAFVGEHIHFALDTERVFRGVEAAAAGNINSIADMKNAFLDTLKYEAEILDIIKCNSFIKLTQETEIR
ncbi:MAG: DUF3137 domain-containing protein [Lachnospiraceae bacterium]|nr:DUF3137 domain-containing protein [Lachnospiraceae bacterium]